jgi:hypothetical protein
MSIFNFSGEDLPESAQETIYGQATRIVQLEKNNTKAVHNLDEAQKKLRSIIMNDNLTPEQKQTIRDAIKLIRDGSQTLG